MADTKLTGLTEDTQPTLDDLLYSVHDPSGSPVERRITIGSLLNKVSGSLVLLKTVTEESGVASIDVEDWYSSDFDEYHIELLNILPVTDGDNLFMRMSTDGGATYDSGANYGCAVFYIRDESTSDSLGANSGSTRIILSSGLSNIEAQSGVSGELKLINPGSTTFYTGVNFHLGMIHATSDYLYNMIGTAKYYITSAVNAFQFYMSSGNIIGTVRVYGIKKSGTVNALSYAENELINSEFNIWQEIKSVDAATTPANDNDTYVCDQWILLSDGDDIADVSRGSTSPPTGSKYFLHSEVETINKKYGFLQPLENLNSLKFTDQLASLSFQVKGTLDNCRAAIISWDGTADSITSDVVSAWNAEGIDPTLATNWTYENTPSNIALTTEWVEQLIEGVSIDTSDMKNLAIFIWVDDTDGALDETLELGKVKLELNSVCTKFISRSFNKEVAKCQRIFNKSYAIDTDVGTTSTPHSGSGPNVLKHRNHASQTHCEQLCSDFAVEMRIVPTIIWYSPNSGAAGYVYNGNDVADRAVSTNYNVGTKRTGFPMLSSAQTAGDQIYADFTANARL